LLIAAGYILGSIPTAYLAGRWIKGIDVQRYGTGTVSGSMIWEHVARWATVPVGLFDMGKATLPTWLGLHLGLGMPVAVAAGLAAVVGHNWSVFLRFRGGRGLGCFLGMLLAIFPWGWPWLLGLLTIGWLLGDSAPFALVGVASLPFFALLLDGPAALGPASGVMLLLTWAKRLEANGRPLPPAGPERRAVLLRRFFLDRDIASHAEWVQRGPQEEGQA
jgi:glycerol-3-phosphate acyltransferase PlsY